MIRSATFTVGILLAIAAFVGFLLLGSILNPAPYQVVIAKNDIPAYATLESDSLAVDAQTMSSQVAQGLVTRGELDAYMGGFTVETIHAGEPLRKSAIVAPESEQTQKRLALMLQDAESVAMVVPVDPKTAPEQIDAGDLVDLVLSLAPASINPNGQTNLSASLATPTPSINTKAATLPTIAPQSTITPALLFADEMNLPVAKVTLRSVRVLAVRRERVANPNFAVSTGAGETQTSAPAFVEGDIQAVLLRVPRASAELVTFAIDNGKVHLSLLSPKVAAAGGDNPTLGVSWNDVIAWMLAERRLASGQVVVVSPEAVTPTTTPTARPTTTTPAQATPLMTPSQIRPAPGAPDLTGTFDWVSNLARILLPLGAGILLVIAAFFVIRRIKS